MDYSDLDEEAQKKRKEELVNLRNKKRYSSIFTFCASVFEILVSMAIIFVLLLLSALLIFRVFGGESAAAATLFQLLALVILIGGIVLGFLIYKKTARAVIKKFNLKEKLKDDVLFHYLTKEEQKQLEEERRLS